MALTLPSPAGNGAPLGPGRANFWRRSGASQPRFADEFEQAGFTFEWHELEPVHRFDWEATVHPASVEICLNLQGIGSVSAGGTRMDLAVETSGFFVANGAPVSAERKAGERHRFLSLGFHVNFLRERLGSYVRQLHPIIGRCLESGEPLTWVSGASPMTHRHRDLLKSVLHPPVLASAQRFWYEIKALEFAAEFFFTAGDGDTLCTRAQRLAAERVARAKEILLANLGEPLSLEELGRRVGCSHFYLSRTFTRETGLTLSQWLRRVRLERAAALLRSGECNVTETALRVGYSSLSHFSEAFHQMYGCCPGLYPLRTPTQQQDLER